ncbi:uncharacterized protein MYCFIDRAFT_50120 [Pseudocercospora fijiensis CIRAD86]|uniref:Major facilitator superfamily (MFS) profile domain-containing protein n=1 Tax=Pseudocercospora fijiensis (strain CIRAD86) TaxID=383855 RepID=M2YLV2_PSEFD|nr:uncharacterized protein MYCFIDRAFT_50120 [Pseudocercospora fijiensis CIRAD86]EME78710.1 hypothetical protein MYCFIDRAFT_50120 [Pseudocercospora fijiensis CIRAD86]
MDKEARAEEGLPSKDSAAELSTSDLHHQDEKPNNHDFNEQTYYVPKSTIITIFLACSTVDFLALMDQTTLAASLTIVSNALHAGDEQAWIAGAYFVTSTCFQLLYGRLSDIWSRKLILLIGLAIFFIASLGASLANTSIQLIVFRALTGIAGGGIMTVAQMIVSDVVPLRERGKYQGILGSVVALAHGIGPIVGGALASSSTNGWRWIFRLNLPLAVLATACAVFLMPLKKVEGDWMLKLKAIDFFGALLALAGATLIVLALTWGGAAYPWNSAHVVATLVVGLCASVGFVVWQWKGPKYPLVPLHIFKAKIVNGACLTMAINGWNFLVQMYYIPSFYHIVYNYSAVRSAALLLPITLLQTAASTISGLVVHWTGRYRESILFGWACWALGLGLYSTLDVNDGLGKQTGYAILTGVGCGNTLQPALIAVQAGVDRKDMAVVTSFRNFTRNFAGSIGLAVAGTILNNLVGAAVRSLDLDTEDTAALLKSPQAYLADRSVAEADQIRQTIIPAYRDGFRIIFLIGASLAAFAFCLCFFLMPQVPLDRDDDEKLKEEGKRLKEAQNKL